jgi:hypothetical protein
MVKETNEHKENDMSDDYYAINWNTGEAIEGPTTLAKAKKAARAAGHEANGTAR